MSSKPTNQKRRNNEKRKEKSRVAARCRRTKEMQIFSELTAALPAKKEEVDQLDKASVMRLAISYLRVRDVVSMLPELQSEECQLSSPKGLEDVSSEVTYMKALDGFVLVMSQQGDIIYCSENIADHLGVSQMEIMGQSVFEFSHPCDHDEVREALRSSAAGRRELLLRLKCTLTSKGRNVHLKSASYKVIHVTGHMLTFAEDKDSKVTEKKPAGNTEDENTSDDDAEKKSPKGYTLVAVGRPIPHPSNIELFLDSKTFLTKHSLDMKFTYSDDSLLKTLGFQPDDIKGRSLYDYLHAADSAALVQTFKSLFSKGQCETGQYRFLAKSGGYAWVQTQATVITDKQQKPISVVCLNYVISGVECKGEVFAAHQVQHADLKPEVTVTAPLPTQSMSITNPVDIPDGAIVGIVKPEEERPIPVTELIFAPRKEVMNKGFLMFSQDEGHTMLKDEPDDLTHLAPTAGDACIPLENSPLDMFDDLLTNNYCFLLDDDLANGSPVDSLPAESLLMSSPDHHETDSSCEQSSLLTDLSLDPIDDIDDGNSPFIPNDDLPVLESAVMWGALPDNVCLAKPQPSEIQNAPSAPALKRLLAAPPTGPPPQDLITNIYSDPGLMPGRSIPSWETGVKRTLTEQEEQPITKKIKRSPSPASTTTASSTPTSSSSPSSSVLMNLLDKVQRSVQQQQTHPKPLPDYPIVIQPQKLFIQNSNNFAGNFVTNKGTNNLSMGNNARINDNTSNNITPNNILTNNSIPSNIRIDYNTSTNRYVHEKIGVINNNLFIIDNNNSRINNNYRNNDTNIIRSNNAKMINNNINFAHGVVSNNLRKDSGSPVNRNIAMNTHESRNNISNGNNNLQFPNNAIPLPYIPINNNQMSFNNNTHLNHNRNIPIPVINIIQRMPKKQLLRPNTPNYDLSRASSPNSMSPLNIRVASPMYSSPSSPSTSSYSPNMSPVPRDHSLSPYATPQSLSPVGRYNQPYCPGSRLMSPVGGKCCDPYMINKMQPSPNYPYQQVEVMDTNVSLSPDFWNSDMIQGTNDLLTALDDVKLD